MALRFRAEGAVRVRDGGMEVAWSSPPELREVGPTPPMPLTENERDELDALRVEARYAEELP
jgi:hypothetical protein